jgi:hypothetical protein
MARGRERGGRARARARARVRVPGCEMCGREKQEAAVFQSPGAWRVNERPLPASRLLAAPGRSVKLFAGLHGGQLADLPAEIPSASSCGSE